jgi:hypothetical protein
MKSLSCQLHSEAFLKSFSIVSHVKLICRSDPPRKVCLSCSARATLAFNLNRGFDCFTRFAAARSEAEETIPKRKSTRCLQRHRRRVEARSPTRSSQSLRSLNRGSERLRMPLRQLPDAAQPRSRRAVSQHLDSRAAISPAVRVQPGCGHLASRAAILGPGRRAAILRLRGLLAEQRAAMAIAAEAIRADAPGGAPGRAAACAATRPRPPSVGTRE